MKNPQLVMISDKTEHGLFGIKSRGWFKREHLVEFYYTDYVNSFYRTDDGFIVTEDMIVWNFTLDNE